MTPVSQASSEGFSELGIEKSILAILDHHKFTAPTPIQHKAIPVAITGVDVVGIAQTGTGKTLAFGIPTIQRLGLHKGRGLVILPTRELALQVDETLQKIGGPLGLRTSVLIGGENINRQIRSLQKNPHIIIATPGRMVDHLQQGTVKLENIKILVLDEADRMFDMGFAPQLNQILKAIPKERQTMMFSATMPKEIMDIASVHMKTPLRIEVAPQGTASERVEQEICMVHKDEKIKLLQKILSEQSGTVLIFSRTKFGAKRITQALHKFGYTAAEIHSNKSLAQRIKALDGFKSGAFRILVATDIAARGIDVKNIELVINFDLPDQIEDYVHRIGRTGRAGQSGKAISFATPDQKQDIRRIEQLIRKPIPLKKHPGFAEYRENSAPIETEANYRQNSSRRSQRRSAIQISNAPYQMSKSQNQPKKTGPSTFGRNRFKEGKGEGIEQKNLRHTSQHKRRFSSQRPH